jgi:ABC-type polysaccharide/polyol phosphate transport system ATPase subunit
VPVAAGEIVLEHASRSFSIRADRGRTLKEVLLGRGRASGTLAGGPPPVEALRDVSLHVTPGETVGIVGRNGAGKSSTLRVLAGIIPLHRGRVDCGGQVVSLLELGAGFGRDFSGRENILLNGALHGLTQPEIESRMDDIVDFSELGDFIDVPVKTYSSGMFVRLGFAVAVTADPDVLLVDEVLAVGDLAFQLKCFDRMRALQEEGTTIVVVSHNLHAIRSLCPRTVVLHDGGLCHDGDTAEGIARYHELLGRQRQGVDRAGAPVDALADPPMMVEAFALEDADGVSTTHVRAGNEVVLRLDLRAVRAVEEAVVEVGVYNETGAEVYADQAAWSGESSWAAGSTGRRAARLRMALGTGSYAAYAWVRGPDGALLASPPRPLVFFVAGRPGVKGVADLEATPIDPGPR